MSIWDDDDIKTAEGEFVKFESVGDTVTGVVTSLGKHTFPATTTSPEKTVPQLGLLDDNGEARILTTGQIRLKLALAEHRPEVGDRLTVTYTKKEPRPGSKTLKHFDVKVEKATVAAANARLGRMAGGAPVADDDQPPF